MGKRKIKVIQTDLGTLRHNQANPGIIQAYSKLCVAFAYLVQWYIQWYIWHKLDCYAELLSRKIKIKEIKKREKREPRNIFKARNIYKTLVYSEPRYHQNSDIFKIQGLFRHLRRQTSEYKLLLSLFYEINIMRQLLKSQLFFVKELSHEGGRDFEFFIYLLMHSNKLTYIQLIKVLTYGNSSPKSHEQGYLKFQ